MTITLRAVEQKPVPTSAPGVAPRTPVPPGDVSVLEVRPLSAGAMALRVQRPPGFEFTTTQVASLFLDGERRTMTIASAPHKPYLEFATLHGRSTFKQAFAALKPGDRIGLKGPYGRFQFDASHPAVFLAGHIGISPFHGFLEHAVEQGLDVRGALLHARPGDDAPYATEMWELTRHLPGLRLEAAPAGGLADAERLRPLITPDAIYYIAGSPAEVMGAAAALAQLGIGGDQVRVEMFHGYA